ncbi:tripartite tricarboxylate transporter TctB family protein [Paracoccus sp. Z118]|uniref:tripartite tricarboxylate transporter TctB family protein n=1 Tax=Paracoccus sp. Z118 TaxID=2851017 RepID=UPI001C2C9857|nr:tripartite tricarboxylate transporter TctB family protein [Paracoccus sp. Z118]MBV0893242.1 tripartite tricarboxylate transporter TctB family protein [Paracoccus sp. Z118]
MSRKARPDVTEPGRERPGQPASAPFVARLGVPANVYDLIIFAGLAVVGVAFVVGGLGLEDDPRRTIDPGTVPAIAGGLLVVLSGIGAVQAIRNRGCASDMEVARPFQVFLAMALVLTFPPAIDFFGYYTTAIVWVPAFIWAAGARNWASYLVALVLVLALARFVFEMLLGTPLP